MNPATKGIQYDPSYDKEGNTMTKSNGLPKGYEDWVEVHVGAIRDRQITVTVMEHQERGAGKMTKHISTRAFVPPKPKPTLPDVKPGAVIRYRNKQGYTIRAVYRSARVWDAYWQPHTPVNTACQAIALSDSHLLEDVNADGFMVELDGL